MVVSLLATKQGSVRLSRMFLLLLKPLLFEPIESEILLDLFSNFILVFTVVVLVVVVVATVLIIW